MFEKYDSSLKKCASIFTGMSFFVFSSTVNGANIPKEYSIESSSSKKTESYLTQVNPCNYLKEKVPDAEKKLEMAVKFVKPWINQLENNIKQQVNIKPDRISRWFEQSVKQLPPPMRYFLKNSGFTIEFYSTESPIPLKITRECNVVINISKKIDVIGGYFLIKYTKNSQDR